jgi:hypothetical protein
MVEEEGMGTTTITTMGIMGTIMVILSLHSGQQLLWALSLPQQRCPQAV